MFRTSFFSILARIQGHPVFHTSDTTGRPQEEPQFQLQVALKRFGTEGSTASSVTAIARHFGCGAGTRTAVYIASGNSFDEPLEGCRVVEIEKREEGNAKQDKRERI